MFDEKRPIKIEQSFESNNTESFLIMALHRIASDLFGDWEQSVERAAFTGLGHTIEKILHYLLIWFRKVKVQDLFKLIDTFALDTLE